MLMIIFHQKLTQNTDSFKNKQCKRPLLASSRHHITS